MAASSAIKLCQHWPIECTLINKLERIIAKSELEQLKNEVNPYFLFNMLNNVNILMQKARVNDSQGLLKFNYLLRYYQYDVKKNRVPLKEDIQLLEIYLNLEKIPRDNLEYKIVRPDNIDRIPIAPLLFIIFVENSVRHGVDTSGMPFIHLNFTVQKNRLQFQFINSRPKMIAVKNELGGLGLCDIIRRPELVYPSKHDHLITNTQETYEVNLTIKL